MDADGGNVRRLTDTPGYDGGAFFSADCTKIVWRASRPAPGPELDDYRRLLAQGLVRPGELEIWVADADGSDARQITYLGAASFAPYFYPAGDRVIFSSNFGGDVREFDLWAVDVQGTRLERITHSPGFDGFPIFSPDGSRLAFSSNRNQGKPGETNVFVADWAGGGAAVRGAGGRPLPRRRRLAGRRRPRRPRSGHRRASTSPPPGSPTRFAAIGLEPAGDPLPDGRRDFRQRFDAPTAVAVGAGTALEIDGAPVGGRRLPSPPPSPPRPTPPRPRRWRPATAITAADLGVDDYAGVDAAGKVAVVRRFVPATGFTEGDAERRYSDLRYKAWNAREHGAVGLIVVDLPLVAAGETAPEEAPLPALDVEGKGDAGIPVATVKRAVGRAPLRRPPSRPPRRAARPHHPRRPTTSSAGSPPAPPATRITPAPSWWARTTITSGLGGPNSLAPEAHEPHNGADDNASGTAAVLAAAGALAARRGELGRDVVLRGLLGRGVAGSWDRPTSPASRRRGSPSATSRR